MRTSSVVILFLLTIVLLIISCKKEFTCANGCELNQPPIANAGKDTSILSNSDSAKLDGSESNDPDGTITAFLWMQISGPSPATVTEMDKAISTVKKLLNGIYEFELTVTDNSGQFSKDTVRIAVYEYIPQNRSPVADAGPDVQLILPNNSLLLNGRGSHDPDYNINGYLWTIISGPSSFLISNDTQIQTQLTGLTEGSYEIELKVTDYEGLFAKDTAVIKVIARSETCNVRLIPFGNLSIGRSGVSAVTAGNKILFAGGATVSSGSSEASKRVDIYDTSTKSWKIAELSEARYLPIVVVAGKRIYFAGGGVDVNNKKMDIYDSDSDTWSEVILPTSDMLLLGSTGVAFENKIYFAGGHFNAATGARHSDSISIYNISNNSWSASSAHLSEKRGPTHAVVAGNKIVFAGGEGIRSNMSEIYISDNIDIYDPLSQSISTSKMFEPKVHMTSISVNNKIFWAGGFNFFSGSNWTRSSLVEVYDVSTGSSQQHYLSTSSYWSTALVKENKVLFFGEWVSPNYIDSYDLISGNWTYRSICSDLRLSNTGITLSGNKILVAGGYENGIISDKVWLLEY